MDKSKFKNKKEWRKFGIGLSIILSVIATIQLIIGRELYSYFYGAGIGTLLIGLVLPILLKPIFILFSYIGFVLGWFMTRVILSFLFYVVFTLIGGILRLFGKKFLDLKLDRNTGSYWIDKKSERLERKNYENQF
jgi:hypothetical protein